MTSFLGNWAEPMFCGISEGLQLFANWTAAAVARVRPEEAPLETRAASQRSRLAM